MDDILAPRFIDPVAARKHLEALRWPDGPECPHCGLINATAISGGRDGLYQCNNCREQFTVTVGTVFERSKVPLNKWLLCNHLLCAGKKGMSAHQIHRMLGVTYKTAWFMCHRIREAMKDDGSPLGGKGKTVESDEAFVGGSQTKQNLSADCFARRLITTSFRVCSVSAASAGQSKRGGRFPAAPQTMGFSAPPLSLGSSELPTGQLALVTYQLTGAYMRQTEQLC